jgi:hypothetical protein
MSVEGYQADGQFCSLVAKVRRYAYRVSEEGDASRPRESNNLTTPTLPPPQHIPRISSVSEFHRLSVQKEANSLLDELKVWDSAYTFIPLHPRTQYGNHAYWHALRLRLLREVFRVSRDDKRVKDAVGAIMEISKEMLALYGRIVWYVLHYSVQEGANGRMTWPILIAGFNMAVDDPSRSAALEFLCEFE